MCSVVLCARNDPIKRSITRDFSIIPNIKMFIFLPRSLAARSDLETYVITSVTTEKLFPCAVRASFPKALYKNAHGTIE